MTQLAALIRRGRDCLMVQGNAGQRHTPISHKTAYSRRKSARVLPAATEVTHAVGVDSRKTERLWGSR